MSTTIYHSKDSEGRCFFCCVLSDKYLILKIILILNELIQKHSISVSKIILLVIKKAAQRLGRAPRHSERPNICQRSERSVASGRIWGLPSMMEFTAGLELLAHRGLTGKLYSDYRRLVRQFLYLTAFYRSPFLRRVFSSSSLYQESHRALLDDLGTTVSEVSTSTHPQK